MLSWLAPSLPRVRYKILPAWLLGGENGTKLSLHVEIAPNRAISGEQGEFYTGNAVRRGVQGEFCPAHAVRGGVRGEFCTEAARRGSCWARFVSSWHLPCVQLPGFRHPPVPHPDPPAPAARSTLVAVGVLHYTKPSGGVSPACRTPCSAIPPPIGGGAAAVRGGAVAKVQTHWVKTVKLRRLWLNGSAFWRIRSLSWCVGRT